MKRGENISTKRAKDDTLSKIKMDYLKLCVTLTSFKFPQYAHFSHFPLHP